MRAILIAAVVVSTASVAYAMPVLDANLATRSVLLQNVKIICEENGQCYRPAGRRPVARWIYGDGSFYGPGPYVGPGNYGPPNSHTRWWWNWW
jgi:hypothetical protein